MTTPRKPPTKQQPAPAPAGARKQGEDLQPAATGAGNGSPAAGAMKQFAKTKSESSGRS
jgi:hypothetical protein